MFFCGNFELVDQVNGRNAHLNVDRSDDFVYCKIDAIKDWKID